MNKKTCVYSDDYSKAIYVVCDIDGWVGSYYFTERKSAREHLKTLAQSGFYRKLFIRVLFEY